MATEQRSAWKLPRRRTEAADSPTAPRDEESPPVLESAQAPSLAGVFDGAFDLYKRHAVTLILMTALIFLPTQIITHAVMDTWLKPIFVRLDAAGDKTNLSDSFLAVCGVLVLGVPQAGIPGIVSLLALILASGPMTVAVADITLGRSVSIRRAYRTARAHFVRLIGVWLLVGMACLGIGFIMLLFAFALIGLLAILLVSTMPDALAVTILVLIFALPYLVICALVARWFCLATPLLVLERRPMGYVPARNSRLLGNKGFKRAFAACVFLPLVTFGLQFLTFLSLDTTLESFHITPAVEAVAEIGLSTVVALLYQPYWMIFLTLFYFHFRVAREGLDIVALADQLLPALPPPTPPSRNAAARPPQAAPPVIPALPPRQRPAPLVPPLPPALEEGDSPPAASPDTAERETDAL